MVGGGVGILGVGEGTINTGVGEAGILVLVGVTDGDAVDVVVDVDITVGVREAAAVNVAVWVDFGSGMRVAVLVGDGKNFDVAVKVGVKEGVAV
jgi:hypothetical protein